MFGPRSLALLTVLALAVTVHAKTFSRCELARELVNKGLPRAKINDWVCLVEAESSRRTDNVGAPNKNGSKDYGLFQIINRYWCTESGPAGKDCNVRCQDLLNDSINDDVACAKKVFKRHGFSAWYGWTRSCKGGRAADVSRCFN